MLTNTNTRQQRRLPVGAEVLPEGGVHFRVWAPGCQHLAVVLEREPAPCPDATPVFRSAITNSAILASTGRSPL